MTVAPLGTSIPVSFPAAIGLRTKRTQWAAARSAVKRPRPVISAGSSRRRMARPTQVMPAPLVPRVLMGRSWGAVLQRTANHGAHEVTPVLRVGLVVFERIDRLGSGR